MNIKDDTNKPTSEYPTSKEEAIRKNSLYFFTGIPCRNGHVRIRRVSDGHCLDCDRETQKRKRKRRPKAVSKMRRKYYKKNKEHILHLRKKNYAENESLRLRKRDKDLKNTYGIDIKQYNNILKAQGDACGICEAKKNNNKRTKYFDVDHCHESGQVRGLLCTNCNMGLGKFNHDIKWLIAAIKYLVRNYDYRIYETKK